MALLSVGLTDRRLQIKHRKAEMAQEKGGLMASIGQSIAGPRFYETDEVGQYLVCKYRPNRSPYARSGSIGKRPISTASSHSCAVSLRPLTSWRNIVQVSLALHIDVTTNINKLQPILFGPNRIIRCNGRVRSDDC